MLRETLNNVVIEGILSEIDLTDTTYSRDGQTVEAIRGTIKVLVETEVLGKPATLDIPVQVFHNKVTRAGNNNPAYASIMTAKNEYASIAAVGKDNADRVRITGARLDMSEYIDQEGEERVYPRISASFITRVKKEDFVPKANWSAELFIASTQEIEGDETRGIEPHLQVMGIAINYSNVGIKVPVKIYDQKLIDGFQKAFQNHDTVPMSGQLNFSSTTETIVEESIIGEDEVRTRTRNFAEILLTGAKAAIEDAFTVDDIKSAMALRTEKLQAQKAKSDAKAKAKAAGQGTVPAPGKSIQEQDLGF